MTPQGGWAALGFEAALNAVVLAAGGVFLSGCRAESIEPAQATPGAFMNYHITRGDQKYGPYTLADLQRYVASGHVLMTDLAKSEEMTEWVPVSQILNPTGLPPAFEAAPAYGAGVPSREPYQGGYAQAPGYAQAAGAPSVLYDDPPNLSWGLVLLFDFLTCGIFQLVWNFILSAWMKRVQPTSQAIIYYAVGYGLQLISSGFSIPIFFAAMHHMTPSSLWSEPAESRGMGDPNLRALQHEEFAGGALQYGRADRPSAEWRDGVLLRRALSAVADEPDQ